MPPNISFFSAFSTNEVTRDQNWNLKSHNLPSPELPSHPRIPILYKVTSTPQVFGVLFGSHWPPLPGAIHPHGLWVPKQFQVWDNSPFPPLRALSFLRLHTARTASSGHFQVPDVMLAKPLPSYSLVLLLNHSVYTRL